MESNKKEANTLLAQLLVKQLIQYTGKSLADLERILEVGSHGEIPGEKKTSGDAGATLSRWLKGRSKRVTMRTIQELAQVAYAKGMLPPLRIGGLRRRDVFRSVDQTCNADDAWIAENKHMKHLQKLHASAIKAIKDFATALEDDMDLLIVDMSVDEEKEGRSAEIGPSDVRALAIQLDAIEYVKVHIS